jgi:hypothetical protein
VVVFLLLLLVACVQQPPASHSPPDVVEIDGAKNPELLPEHVVWSSGFHTLALMKENNVRLGEKFLTQLTLSDADATLLWAEVERFKARADRCQEKGKAIYEQGKAAERKLADIETAMKANTLQCRTAMLDAKDRLLAVMSPEGQTLLINWMLSQRAKIKSSVPKSELDFFRQPR